MRCREYNVLPLLVAILLFVGGCERQVVRSKGYGGFQVDRGGARPAPTAFAPTPNQATIKTRKKFDPLGSIGSFFAGVGDAFGGGGGEAKEESAEPVLSGEAAPDSAYRPSWRKAQPEMEVGGPSGPSSDASAGKP